MLRTPHFSAAAGSMAQFIARLDLSCLLNAGPSAVVDPVKRKLLVDIVYLRALSFTQLVLLGEEENSVSLRPWRIVIRVRCNSRLKMKSRRSLSLRSVAAHMAIRFRTQRRSP